ncbi:FecR family protein [Extensimonas perlucida]|uniref:FecR family protein n=1 Tax=Extensimonas perlucida TaxID=2590786 RepID=UPI0016425F65|nr:FecR family protein [Extensimonas perlucida]
MDIQAIIAAPTAHPLRWPRPLAVLGLAALCAQSVLAQPASQAPAEIGKIVQVVGEASLEGQPVQAGTPVLEGQRLRTGANGYLYIQTADQGFFILRPNSAARVPAYRIDAAHPAQSQFKFELEQGVARSISGRAVPAARQNYRFNTPVAAIGVLGTDFTVFTTPSLTRVAVSSGGVIVSGFGEGCQAEGLGPCQNPSRQQLLAQQAGYMLQVSRDSVAPQLLRGAPLAPDTLNPPRPDEPSKTLAPTTGAAPDTSLAPLKMSNLDDVQRSGLAPAPAVPPAILWGRWQPIADQPVNMDLATAMQQGKLGALSSHFAVLRSHDAPWVMPQQAAASFQLKGYQAQVQAGGRATPAALENGQLTIQFAQRSFTTSFDLVQGGERQVLHAQGALDAQGSFSNPSQFMGNSMVVQGLVGQPAGAASALQAGYVFQSRLDALRNASGVTFWSTR